jgi:two-component system response regulator AtoC
MDIFTEERWLETTAASAEQGYVVLAEDDRIMRDLVTTTLRQGGYEVEVARNGVDLLRLLEEQMTDGEVLAPGTVIISDIRMPQLDGLSVLEKLRSLGWRTPVILMTAFGDTDTHERAHALGASAALNKPFDLETRCSRRFGGCWPRRRA